MSTLDVAPRLVGEFVVPRDLPIGGTTVGSLSGRDRRSGRYLTIGDYRSPRRAFAREFELGPHEVRFTKVQYCHRAEQAGRDADEIRVDDRTGNLVWSYECRPAPEDETMVVDWECRSAADEASDEHNDGDAEPQTDARPMDPLPDAAPGRAYGKVMDLDSATSTRCRLTEKAAASDYGRTSGAGFLDAGDVTALHSAPRAPINPVRLTLLPDLAEAGVPDPDNFEGTMWRPQRPSGRRTLLLVSGNDATRELRAPAIPPKPL